MNRHQTPEARYLPWLGSTPLLILLGLITGQFVLDTWPDYLAWTKPSRVYVIRLSADLDRLEKAPLCAAGQAPDLAWEAVCQP